ncbi:MAG: helix-turn-helix domain-containing protein [Silicimonas sp.]|nr:helix-turn-helix domain-containing protein [Silicimonas sp.]
MGGNGSVPEWVPESVLTYLAHVESGRSIRSLAREAGCHASTILRRVRRFETRRDDLLVDLALRRLSIAAADKHSETINFGGLVKVSMSETVESTGIPGDAQLKKVAPRVLRRLNETGACLAIASDMDKAVIARDTPDGQTLRTMVVERVYAEAMALKEWITATSEGRITRYRITSTGRMALKRFLAEEEALRVGMGEGADPYSEQHRDWAKRNVSGDKNKRRGIRYNASESPLSALARRKDKDGKPFLSAELVAVGERLREDFELAQMGPRVTQNWERFLSGGARGDFPGGGEGGGSQRARDRVAAALKDLGPGLGDVVLRCCCFLEGMEAVEQRLDWSARSGKIVLRIALMRLKAHYDEEHGNWSPLIG